INAHQIIQKHTQTLCFLMPTKPPFLLTKFLPYYKQVDRLTPAKIVNNLTKYPLKNQQNIGKSGK
ncbi:hypothetical protein ACTHTP_11455, partial [Neisseria sp. P0017.S001]|uniref:hypothetical protein n=1 Tax=Neisseria sp. P0017.S001 TaxID=3436777 RepID=UPI003F7FF88D